MNYTEITDTPLLDIHPSEWKATMHPDNTTVFQYRNLQHFKNHVSKISQRENTKCGVAYNIALSEMLAGKPTIQSGDYEIVKQQVKEKLVKRGLISDSIYESYEYTVDGEGVVDVGLYLEGNPECILTPKYSYTNYFYELYISISYDWTVDDETIKDNMAKILATVELLEKEHYYCKITLIFPDQYCNNKGDEKSNLFVLIPIFSHKQPKSIETMSSILNERLLRKFMFAVLENTYGSNLSNGYGSPVSLAKSINVGYNFDPIKFTEDVLAKVVTPCQTK